MTKIDFKKPLKLLIVDDEEAIRRNVRANLEDHGFEVVVASNGYEGIDVYIKENPDVIVTDLRMPQMDGFGLLKYFKAHGNNVPIIVISGTGDVCAEEDSYKLGAVDYLYKPIYDIGVIENAIEKVMIKLKH